jgi:hypothetical protein
MSFLNFFAIFKNIDKTAICSLMFLFYEDIPATTWLTQSDACLGS